ncbi:unnamed protein product [Tetraodon nigroviridis]|uniref:(spotted green pufferfish) hypothetical protein n=1 Tax=Tetraodon nigroviridis TaxID=99883 RepID=Q4T2Z5_TETNG|nr:unnamed protein product [Tetraodon nigroviridis]
MGTWHTLRMAFILGSLFTVLLIIVYWDDIGGFNLYPPRERTTHHLRMSYTFR